MQTRGENMILCQKCGIKVRSLSPMRKWCVDCRRVLGIERAKAKKKRIKKSRRS